jgi:hypothetical protein
MFATIVLVAATVFAAAHILGAFAVFHALLLRTLGIIANCFRLVGTAAGSFVFAAVVQFVIRFFSGFKMFRIIAGFGNGLFDLCGI